MAEKILSDQKYIKFEINGRWKAKMGVGRIKYVNMMKCKEEMVRFFKGDKQDIEGSSMQSHY